MFAAKHGIEAGFVSEDQTHEVFKTECLIASLSEDLPKKSVPLSSFEQAYAQELLS
jgi:hypothetical protein